MCPFPYVEMFDSSAQWTPVVISEMYPCPYFEIFNFFFALSVCSSLSDIIWLLNFLHCLLGSSQDLRLAGLLATSSFVIMASEL
jgi:hypothetical protein